MAAVQFAFRLVYALHHRIDSDEPQHLHVAWGWAHGLVQYRDLFDNHAPLFHLLTTPLVLALGERADIVVLMRLAMIPVVAAGLVALWRLGRALFPPGAALWGALLAGLEPSFMRISVECRADILWMTLWLATLLALLAGAPSRRRSLTAGLLMGATFAASLKTALLVVTLAGGALLVEILGWRRGRPPSPRRWGEKLALITAGTVVIPGILALWFAAHGAGGAMVYDTVTHNLVSGLGGADRGFPRWLLFLPILALLVPIADRIIAAAPDPGTGGRRAVLFLSASGYLAALAFTWPVVTEQDILPAEPVVILLAAG